MDARQDRGLPDFGSRDPHEDERARSEDRTAAGPSVADPYATDPYAGYPYVGNEHAGDPYAPHAVSSPQHPYPAGPPQYSHPSGPPVYGAFPPPLPSSSAAVTGFVLGLLGIVMCGGLTSPVGIWFSARGMRETGPTATRPMGGRGLAVAGMTLSLVGLIPLLFLLLYVAFAVIGFAVAMTA